MIQSRKTFSLIVLLSCLAGCYTSVSDNVIPSPQKTGVKSTNILETTQISPKKTVTLSYTPTNAHEHHHTNSPSPSKTPQTLSFTGTPTPSLTSTPDTQIQMQCLEIASPLSSEAKIDGNLVLMGGSNNPSFLLNMQTGERSSIAEEGLSLFSAAVSPDRKWLAYQEYDKTAHAQPFSLVLLSADGQTRKVLPWKKNWSWIADWLNTNNLLIDQVNGNSESDLHSLILLNPFISDQKELLPDYPDIFNWYPNNSWAGYSRVETVYDPLLSRVIYPKLDEIALVDISTGEELITFPNNVSFLPVPKWSPDGEQAIIVGSVSNLIPLDRSSAIDLDLFSMSRDGDIQRLTSLSAIYSKVEIGYYSWSPDSRYLAFWLSVEPISYPDIYQDIKSPSTVRLAILDTFTQEVTNYCVPGYYNREPVWSPNSRYIVGEYLYGDLSGKEFHSHVYLIDTKTGHATEIAKDLTPIGWMVSAP